MIDGSQSDTASAAMNDTPAMTTQAKDPTIYNYLNAGGYVFNTILTFFGPAIFNLPTNSELSERYATLVTPSWWTFSIWLIIFLFQGIFVVVQMMEEYRHLPIIQEGIYHWYFVVCALQGIWTLAFCNEIMWLSVIIMAGIMAALYQIVWRLSEFESDQTKKEYWLFRFPFSLHGGWIIVAFVLNLNVFSVADPAAVGHPALTYLSLLTLVAAAVYALVGLSVPDYTIPSVLAWATMGIAVNLQDPENGNRMYDEDTIGRVYVTVSVVCAFLVLGTTGFAVWNHAILPSRQAASEIEMEGPAGETPYQGSAMTANASVFSGAETV